MSSDKDPSRAATSSSPDPVIPSRRHAPTGQRGETDDTRHDPFAAANGADAVHRLAVAIDDLAAADHGALTDADLARRVANVWTLAGAADPELARRAASYGSPADPGPHTSD